MNIGMGSVGVMLKRPASTSARAGARYPGVSGSRTADGSACAIQAAQPTRATAAPTIRAPAQAQIVRRVGARDRSDGDITGGIRTTGYRVPRVAARSTAATGSRPPATTRRSSRDRETTRRRLAVSGASDRKSTRLNSSSLRHLVCRLLLEKKNKLILNVPQRTNESRLAECHLQ